MASSMVESSPRFMREVVQRKFLEDMIDSAAGWKVLVMDEKATRAISASLTMYDIMERRVTIVEKLRIRRQPFPNMDVIYFCEPSVENLRTICEDFTSKEKAKYGNVHMFFLGSVTPEAVAVLQNCPLLAARARTFREVSYDFLAWESSVFHFDEVSALERLYRTADSSYATYLGRRLANVCITLNEHPSIRYLASSQLSGDIARAVQDALASHKRRDPSFWAHGDDNHTERERAQLLILDRAFDPVTPLMHEYSYQAMVNDLLEVDDGVISYNATNNRGVVEEKQALLNESDEFWATLRHQHIAKVIDSIKERMSDIIQNSSGAALAKSSGKDMDITAMAAAVKKLPEYTQTMTKLSQHVALASQCMDKFSKSNLMALSQMEQTITTGTDEDHKEIKGNRLLQELTDCLSRLSNRDEKMRLIAIFFLTNSHLPGSAQVLQQVFQAGRLNAGDQDVIKKFTRMLATSNQSGGVPSYVNQFAAKTPVPEGEYSNSRHIPLLQTYLESLLQGNLPTDKFPSLGPAGPKVGAKSLRKFGAASKFQRKDNSSQFTGGRVMAFVAGGLSFAELRAGYELMQKEQREVILGSTHISKPDQYLVDVGAL